MAMMRKRPGTSRELWEVRRKAEKLGDYKCTSSERMVLGRLVGDGWTVFNRGWPDFLAIRDGQIRFIEVKSGERDRPSPHQQAVFKALAWHFGIDVEVLLPGGTRQGL